MKRPIGYGNDPDFPALPQTQDDYTNALNLYVDTLEELAMDVVTERLNLKNLLIKQRNEAKDHFVYLSTTAEVYLSDKSLEDKLNKLSTWMMNESETLL